MASLALVHSLFGRLSLVGALVFASGCGSPPPPLPPPPSQVGPTLDSPHVIRVCVKQPGVPANKRFWASHNGNLILDDLELALFQRHGESIYFFDATAKQDSVRMLPIPHNALKCAEPSTRGLASSRDVLAPKHELGVGQAQETAPQASAVRVNECKEFVESGQTRRPRSGTQTCTRTRTLKARSRPEQAQAATPAQESSTLARAVPATTAQPLADWNVQAPNTSGLDPQRAMECVGSLCHSRHPNFIKKGGKPAAGGALERRSPSTGGGGGGAKPPKAAPGTRKPPTGPKPAAQSGTPIKPKATEAPKVKEPNRNRVDDRPATLYERVDRDRNLRKHGVTHHEDPTKRYTKKQLGTDRVITKERGPRKEMIKKERELVETNPGPDNREPWAGKRKPPQTGGKDE